MGVFEVEEPLTRGNDKPRLVSVLNRRPRAAAVIAGDGDHPALRGVARFYPVREGAVVFVEVGGLPRGDGPCGGRVFGLHIHAGGDCGGEGFPRVMAHYDPDACPHPGHAGDLPPLFGCGGRALSVFLTDRFTVDEVVGRTVIVHDGPDDFTTQPSGNSGTKIACGVIRRVGA